MSYRTAEFHELNEEFAQAATNVLNDTDTTIKGLQNTLDAYNAIVLYAEIDFDRKKNKTKEFIKAQVEVNRTTLQRCYEKLNLPLSLPGALLSTIHYIPTVKPIVKPEHSDTQTQTDIIEQILTETQTNIVEQSPNASQTEIVAQTLVETQTDSIVQALNSTQTDQIENTNNSTQTENKKTEKMDPATFLKLCGSQINKEFSGDPLLLKPFIKQIQLLQSVAGDNLPTLLLFVPTRLNGKALECVRENPANVDEIIEDLNKFIKPPNSKVVGSQIQGLRFNAGKAQEFTDQAEKLAESLQRTLIIEGISQGKAREMTVDRTIELCRQNAKTERVGTILASTTFVTPKDVLAKFVVETTKDKNEKQILTFRQENNPQNRQNRFNNRNANNDRNRNNPHRQRTFTNSNYQNNSNGNNFRNFRNNRNSQNNQRGRGGFRNNYNNYNNQNNNNDRYVRVVAENYHSPSEGRAEIQATATNQPAILRLTHGNGNQ